MSKQVRVASRPLLLVAVMTAAVGLAACAGGSGTADGHDGTVLAVTVDAAGDEQQERAMDIADRYAPDGTFTLEQTTESKASTNGEHSTRSATVVVFTVAGDVDEVADRLRDEPHVLDVAERYLAFGRPGDHLGGPSIGHR